MYDFRKDYNAFTADLPRLLKEHDGMVVVYHNGRRDLREYQTLEEALYAGAKAHGVG